jgi:hypothetical protein
MGARLFKVISMGLSVLLMLSVAPAGAAGVTWRVTNDGVDSGSCGAAASPCRSMDNATDGDTISVGAGPYGDISGTGFSRPGDEHPGSAANNVACMICVTKGLRILSLHGADVTSIKAPAGFVGAAVLINHDSVTFGSKSHGFTVSGAGAAGIQINIRTPDVDFVYVNIVSGIKVGGNIDIGDGTGFEYLGAIPSDRFCQAPSLPYCRFSGQVTFSDNEAVNSGTGFSIQQGAFDGEPILLENNVARGGGTGFYAERGSNGLDNLEALPLNVAVVGNIAAGGSGFGFNLNGPGATLNNTATGYAQGGFLIVPANADFTGNSIIGNGGPGVIVDFSLDDKPLFPGDAVPAFHAFSHNNIFGNDRNRPVLLLRPDRDSAPTPYNPGPSAHCGILNVGELSGPVSIDQTPHPGDPVQLPAAGNFWGSTRGPAPTGPGDAIGGVCDQNNGTTTATTFATASF